LNSGAKDPGKLNSWDSAAVAAPLSWIAVEMEPSSGVWAGWTQLEFSGPKADCQDVNAQWEGDYIDSGMNVTDLA
jgi:hypothetical protein